MMALDDLTKATPDTTSEEIKAFAEQVAKEVEAERKGEPEKKSDAQITNEQADIPQPSSKLKETSVETNSDSDTALDGEESGDADESPEWLTDDVKAEAAAYGIEESELADFASREELDRAFRLFDKTALEAGRKAKTKGEEKGTTRNEKGQFVKPQETKAEPPKEATPKEGRFEVSLNADVYDEGIISEFTRLRDHYESRLEALESQFLAQSVVAKERHFDSLVDSLGHTDLFGVTDKETAQEKQRRETLYEEVETYLAGREALGRPTELNDTIVNRIARSLFAEELSKKELKQRTRKIAKQSDGRMGGSPTKPLRPSDNPRDHFDKLYQQMQGH